MQYPFIFAQTVGDFKTKLADVLTIIMILGFLYGTIIIISGARQIRHGDYQAGKESIISGLMIAAAPLLMRILYQLFGINNAAL